ncbi:MAG: SUMF1/EgtB/PvdO family nonheme iron enzyme [bacterium]|nr:SUMF1/EgtB/PvdO family nonheme iron enzyme [bacterium]
MLSVIFSAARLIAATPTITAVTAQQRYPWNGKVDISYKVTGDIAGMALTNGLITTLKVTATDTVENTSYTATTESLSGATSLAEGSHAIVWDLDRQGVNLKSANVVFNVSCETNAALYCVIDLSAGAEATSYPVTYLAEEPADGFTNDTYRTTKLALRRCDAGTFIMGEDQSAETHRVTLTKPFYMGVFEVTQKQWMLVMGAWPNSSPSSSYGSGDGYPAYYVSYNNIRGSSNGAKWPSSSVVDATSFLGKLQARTKLNFDLPTEAQWEYACRAGTTTTYYWGSSPNVNYAWYSFNSDSTHPVGTKKPNAWGLYDMSGNVWEWCLDWDGALAYGTDPKGSSWGSCRVKRGGSWFRDESYCASSYSSHDYPSSSYINDGFRLSRTLP